MRYQRALELFFLKAKEEFDRKKKARGSEAEGVRINYFGCDFVDDKVVLMGQRVVLGGAYPLILPENHDWKEGVAAFESIMKDFVE